MKYQDEFYIELMRLARIDEQRFLRSFKAILCDHKFNRWSHGFKCSECDLYTGSNSTLNNCIEEQH